MRPRSFAVAAVCAVALAGCSSHTPRAAAPPRLPVSTIPSKLAVLGTDIVVQPNTTKKTRDAFRSVGPSSLVAESGVWELRKADRLVGTLEVVTLDARRVNTARDRDRTAMRSQILAGDAAQLEVDGLPVWSTKDGDRVLYVWYGRQVLSVLQVRADSLDPDETVTQLVTRMTEADAWPALPPEAFEEKS